MIKLCYILIQILNVLNFGAIGDGRADDQPAVQRAVDSAVKLGGAEVFLPLKHKFLRPVFIANFKAGKYQQVCVKIIGTASFWAPTQQGTQVIAAFKDGFAIGWQEGKGVVIEGINFTGAYDVPADNIYTTPFENYGDTSCIDKRFASYVALSQDPATSKIPADGGYTNYQWIYRGDGSRGGSTGTKIRNCSFSNFTGAIAFSQNGFTQNGELCTIEFVRFTKLKFGFAGCQDQEKTNTIEHVGAWGSVHTVFVWNKYGNGSAGFYKLSNISIAAGVGKVLYRASQGGFGLFIDFMQCESLGGFGHWSTGGKDAMQRSSIGFQHPKNAGAFQDSDLTGSGVTFRDCDFRFYGFPNIPVMMVSRNNKFENSGSNGIYVNPIKGYYNNGQDTTFRIRHIARTGINISNDRKAVLFNSLPNTGDIVIFSEMGNNGFAGRAEVESNSGKAVTLRWISQGIKSNETYNIGIYENKTTGSSSAVLP